MCLACAAVALLAAAGPIAPAQQQIITYPHGIDALSVATPSASDVTHVRHRLPEGDWSDWQVLVREDEQDPRLRESNLVFFPNGTTQLDVRSTATDLNLHPIDIDEGPAFPLLAALVTPSDDGPFILSRREWGADDSLLVTGEATSRSETEGPSAASAVTDAGEGGLSQREQDCLDDQTNYPDEFTISKTVRSTPSGERLRWAWQYSPEVDLLVVHHTAGAVGGETRTGLERMRALYQYHAQSRGWGDIGYHYVIDEKGQVYEGKAGGKGVVGGHAYCHNVGTIGIALMGNFEEERPSQAQVQALQKLTALLADAYDLDLDRATRYHGTALPRLVGHRDLLSTDCPGFSLYGVLDQVRQHVLEDDLDETVTFPAWPQTTQPRVDRSAERRGQRLSSSSSSLRSVGRGEPTGVTGLRLNGSRELRGRPLQRLRLSVTFNAGPKAFARGTNIADITRTSDELGLWRVEGETLSRLRDRLVLPASLKPGQSMQLTLELQLPATTGSTTLTLDDQTIVITTEGRALRDATGRTPLPPRSRSSSSRTSQASSLPPRSGPRPTLGTSSSRGVASSSRASAEADPLVRVKLSTVSNSVTLTLPTGTRGTGDITTEGETTLSVQDGSCALDKDGRNLTFGTVRLTPPSDGLTTVQLSPTLSRRYHGTLECQVLDGALVLINELPLEDYMRGVGEQPDTEPYEKQRTFAIAARSYVLYYLNPEHRKFPGQPYDASDDPAIFQVYAGASFEFGQPNWAKAVNDTAGLVLKKDDDILRLPYFSSSDGRTRAPDEVGWKNFPHADIFSSKPDPWCAGQTLRGHGVGMSGCGAEAQANEGKTAEEILAYYYPGTTLESWWK
jgi:peptidoglycan hydrolase-like amidase